MGIGQVGGDVQLEILIVRDHRIPQLQHCSALLLVGLHQRQKEKGWDINSLHCREETA